MGNFIPNINPLPRPERARRSPDRESHAVIIQETADSPSIVERARIKIVGLNDRAVRWVRVSYLKTTITTRIRIKIISQSIGRWLLRGTATMIALVSAVVLVAFADAHTDKFSETHLAAAQIIGASLALILSLSIIPAQRAAELFSIAILKLFATDRMLVGVFATLVATTTASLLLGTNLLSERLKEWSLAIQFILLGISFDAIRLFYVTTLDLLAPETAIRRVVANLKSWLKDLARLADQVVAVQIASNGAPGEVDRVAHALMASGGDVPQRTQSWADQLEEFAHRFIARRDSNATIESIKALGTLATEYSALRAKSILLRIEMQHLLAGPQSDLADVLNPIYECLHRIVEDGAAAKNEKVVQFALKTMGQLTIESASLTAKTDYGAILAPLSFGAVFYFGRMSRVALDANMIDATLAAIASLKSFLLLPKSGADLSAARSQALDTLFVIIVDGYAKPQQILLFEAVRVVLLSLKSQIDQDDFEDMSFESSLRRLAEVLPAEIVADAAGQRPLMTLPTYDMGFEASIPWLVQEVATKAKLDLERPRANPYGDLMRATEVVRNHYRQISKLDFRDTLLLKWIIDSLNGMLCVLLDRLARPLSGAESHSSKIQTELTSQISWMSAFFPAGKKPASQLRDATDHLANLAIDALHAGFAEVAQKCAETLQRIASNVEDSVSEYTLADIHVALEIIARGCETIGNTKLGAVVRAMIDYPKNYNQLPQHQQDEHARARATRTRQFEQALREASGRRGYRDGPVERLSALIDSQAEKPKA